MEFHFKHFGEVKRAMVGKRAWSQVVDVERDQTLGSSDKSR